MLLVSSILHSRTQVTRGVMATVCAALFISLSMSSLAIAQEIPASQPTYSFTVQPADAAQQQRTDTLTADRPWSGERPWSFWRTTRQVIFDPTTYAPALISYESTKLDWDTSQVFFRNGYVEGNPRFTISGNPNDTPMSYRRGNRLILTDTLENLGGSLANNFLERTFEQMMIERFPNHPKLMKTLGWIERSAFASYWSYRLSANHFRQWQDNKRMAAELGLK
jgi:hypothetical protein